MKKDKRSNPAQREPVDDYLRNRKERSEREYRRPHNNDTRRWQDRWGSEDFDDDEYAAG